MPRNSNIDRIVSHLAMGVHANSDTEVVFSQFPGDRKHPGRSEAADPFRIWKELGSRPGQWQSTCLRVYVSTYVSICGSRCFMILLWNLLVSPRRLWVSSLFELSTATQMLWRPDKHRAKTQHRQRARQPKLTAAMGRRQRFFDLRHGHMALPSKSRFSMNCYEQKYELLWIGMNYSI